MQFSKGVRAVLQCTGVFPLLSSCSAWLCICRVFLFSSIVLCECAVFFTFSRGIFFCAASNAGAGAKRGIFSRYYATTSDTPGWQRLFRESPSPDFFFSHLPSYPVELDYVLCSLDVGASKIGEAFFAVCSTNRFPNVLSAACLRVASNGSYPTSLQGKR